MTAEPVEIKSFLSIEDLPKDRSASSSKLTKQIEGDRKDLESLAAEQSISKMSFKWVRDGNETIEE